MIQGIDYETNRPMPAQVIDSALATTSPIYTLVKYAGAGFTYFCNAVPGTARSTATWRVSRLTDATGDIVYAGTGLFEHAATDLATVAALTYTLGA